MTLTTLDIKRIANLARLEMTPEQVDAMTSELNEFFDIVEQMRLVDTKGVIPMAHPMDAHRAQSLRLMPDIVSEEDQRQANQRNAPSVEMGLFLVPKVIE